MKTTITIISLFVGLVGLLVFAQQQRNESSLEWFNRMDRDKDGKLSKKEVPSPRFKEFDSDGDGFVTLAEYIAFVNRQALKQLDRDGDGKISQQEFHQLYKDADSYFEQRRKLAQPADGRKLGGPFPVKAGPLGLRFTQDYFPGTKDSQGRIIAATEANQLVAHRGQLFASFGATYRNPPTPDPGFQGFGVLRKESAKGHWLVDLDLGPAPYRVEVMSAINFTTDAQGRKLPQPAARLVAARWSPNKTILARNDATGKWEESPVAGVQVYHPGFPNPPHNGSHYLVRHSNATYDWVPIFDPAHPVPVGRSLDATRRILVSPFAEDQGRVLYFCGYDGPYADNRSAWIYRGTLKEKP